LLLGLESKFPQTIPMGEAMKINEMCSFSLTSPGLTRFPSESTIFASKFESRTPMLPFLGTEDLFAKFEI